MSQSLQKAKITNSTILKAHNATDFGIQSSSNSSVANIVIINCYSGSWNPDCVGKLSHSCCVCVEPEVAR